MKLKLKKHDWGTYYPVHCKLCQWTGNSEFVVGDGDGPFYCPYCGMPDPTDYDFSIFIFQFRSYFGYGLKAFFRECLELARYLSWRTFSLVTHPVRIVYAKWIVYRRNCYWENLGKAHARYWTGH